MERVRKLEDINLYSLIPADLLEDETIRDLLQDKKKLDKALAPLYDVIPYSKDSMLKKEYVQLMDGMEWMEDVNFNLIYASKTTKRKSLSEEKEFLDKFLDRLESECIIVPEYVSECGLPILAVDTETTSLIINYRIHGGTIVKDFDLVGVPVATSKDDGYYLPVNHNETDKIANFSIKAIQYFLQQMSDRFFLLYFNFNYDASVLHHMGTKLHVDRYSDLYHVSKAIGIDTLPDFGGFSEGLKAQSKYFLNRKMLEINEVVGSKGHIVFSRVCAKDAVSYACADGVNTYGLFQELVLDEESDEFNPYLYNGAILTLDHKALWHSISMFRHNLPLNDLEGLKENIYTIINRIMLLEDNYKKIKGTSKYAISSPDDVNLLLGSKILNELLLEAMGETLSMDILRPEFLKKYPKVKGLVDVVGLDFGLEAKIDSNKSRGEFLKIATRKEGWGKSAKGVAVLDLIKKNINNEYWSEMLDEDFRKELYKLTGIVDNYRGLVLELQRLGKMYRYAVGDDRGYATASIDLQFSGADTRRFKNSKGKGNDRLILSGQNLNLLSYYGGNGVCGINAQGLPATVYAFVKKSEGEKGEVKRIIDIKDKRFTSWLKRKRKLLDDLFTLNLKTKFSQKK